MNPLVSVIIPVYNVAHYLREALDSVIGQTYHNLEILIIDDGSTDESGGICDEYKFDARVTVIHQKNGGLSTARNAGLDLAQGEFVSFLDPDDAYDTFFVERLIAPMISDHHDIAVCRFSVYKTTGRMHDPAKKLMRKGSPDLLPKEGVYERDDALCALIDGRLSTTVWDKVYKRSLWDDIRFPDGHNHEDLETFYRVLDICASICIIDSLLYFHRKRSGSITVNHTKQNNDDWDLAYLHLYQYVEANTPKIFSREQLSRLSVSRLVTKMIQFVNVRDKEYEHHLRGDIIELAKGIDQWSCRLRIGYFMVCHCPWLLKISYAIYLPVRRLIREITGK